MFWPLITDSNCTLRGGLCSGSLRGEELPVNLHTPSGLQPGPRIADSCTQDSDAEMD